MSKDPAFLFYSSDFLTGISDLTMEERGQFITLLCIQHQKGRLTKKNIGIAVPNATADAMAKFKIDENGLYYNERLEIESNKRKEHSEKQRQRALDGWKKRKGKKDATANATALPLEDEDVNIDYYNKLKDEIKAGKYRERSDALYMQLRIKKGSLTPLFKEFKNNIIIQDLKHKSTNDLFIHFSHWLNKLDSYNKLSQYKK